MGIKILYGGNEFYFRSHDTSCNPPTLLAKGKVWRPGPHKPTFYEDRKSQVNTIMDQIERHVPLLALQGWAYYDEFLRFLYVIGPKNAALLKSLKFRGEIKIHICSLECDGIRCDDDFIIKLRIYVQFIKKFCPNLEKLTLWVEKDTKPIVMGHLYPEDAPTTDEQALLSLLNSELRELPMLKELLVLDGRYKSKYVMGPEEEDWNLDFVKSSVKWFQERSKQRAEAALQELRIRQQQKETAERNSAQSAVCCGFCGEGHVWAECCNLCNFCEGYGHLRKKCPTTVHRWRKLLLGPEAEN